MLDHPDPGTRLRAIEIFYDRLCGRPVQSVESDVRTLNVTDAIKQMYLQVMQNQPRSYAKPGDDAKVITELRDAEPATATTPSPDGAGDTTTEW
jgi:hypothetical protein